MFKHPVLSLFVGTLAGAFVAALVVMFLYRSDAAELQRILKQSCESYCTETVEPGLFNEPELNSLRGDLREGACVCELREIDPTPWNQDDQDKQHVQDFWLER